MIKLDLITGFLGSGKTTFIHSYAKYLANKGYKVGIIINDLGAINIDMMLLSDLEALGIEILQVTSCCPGDEAYKRRFISKLINLKLRGYNYFLAEPSGAFDVNTFFDIINDDFVSSFEIKSGIISIVDPNLLFLEEGNVYVSQLLASSKVVVSRMNDTLTLDSIKSRINELVSIKTSNRVFNDSNIILSYNDDFNDVQFDLIINSTSYSEYINVDHNEYESIFLLEPKDNFDIIKSKCENIMDTNIAGNIIRIKGFIKENDIYKEINFTKNDRSIKDNINGQNVLIIVGKRLNSDVIHKMFETNL